jgi:exodeoxyribonuclease VII large subunit
VVKPELAQRPLTVAELAREIQRSLRPLANVIVKGEVSGLKRTAKGNYSFAIRDRTATVQAFLYGSDARRLGVAPEEGQSFVFRGRIEFWSSGQLNLVVGYIQFDDFGRLRAQFEALKQRLELEGAFDPARKRPIPFLPRAVALITSPTGAVIHDLQETILERYPNLEILVYPAQVQGTASPGSVVSALRRCNRDGRAEVAVIARGGGSFEELYAFNTEPVARAILASTVPVVTALGHTSDRTLADMVADAECRTPTEAGARIVPRRAELEARLADRRRRLDREAGRRLRAEDERLALRRGRLAQAGQAVIGRRAEQLERRSAQLGLLTPGRQVALRQRRLVELGERLEAAAQRALRARWLELGGRRAEDRLHRALAERLHAGENALNQRGRRLEALSPERVLVRGYSITTDEHGRILRAAVETAPGRGIRVRLARGALEARVEEVTA